LIVRKEGSDAVFLNELKFQTNTALNLRIPLTHTNTPAVEAALGKEGIIEGVDYRGVPVIADIRSVPNSPWFLVARIDISEAYAPVRERLSLMICLIIALLVGSGASVGLLWRREHALFYLKQYEAAQTLIDSEARYRRLFEAGRDGILILDADSGMVVDVNAFLIELLGYSREQFLGKRIWELGFFKDTAASKLNLRELQEKEFIRYEDLPLEASDGRRIEVEFVSIVYLVDHAKVIQCNIRDITKRRRAEGELIIANKELVFQNEEKEKRAAELIIANKELVFQNEEKEKRAAELIIANKELVFQNEEKEKRAAELITANKELVFQNEERKHAEESFARLAAIVESSDDAIIGKDLNGIITSWNAGAEKLFGYSAQESVGRSIKQIVPQDRLNEEEQILDRIRRNELVQHFETVRLAKNGQLVDVSVTVSPIKDDAGNVVGVSKVARDITERKHAEEALKTSEELFRIASESLTDVVYDWDIKEKVDWYGDIDGITGYPPGAFPRTIGGWAATIHPEDKDRVLAALDGHLKNTAPYVVQYRVGRKDGEWRWWSARGTALRNNRGEPYKMIGSISDITGRKLAEQASKRAEDTLRESEAKFRTLVENIPQKILMKDRNYRWVSINENLARDFGFRPEEVVGKMDADLFPPELAAKYHSDDIRIMETGKAEELEEKYIVAGKETWVNTIKTPVRGANGEIEGVLGVFWDISGRMRAEKEIQQLNATLETRVAERTAQLEASNKELEAFSYSVSHDLRAPLRHVSGYVELLAKHFQSELSEKGLHYLDSIADSAHQMGKLIDDLLQFSRTGRAEIHLSQLDMNGIVHEAVESVSKDNPDRAIEWVVGKLPSVSGDDATIRLVWINLLSNAAKFTRTRAKAVIEIGAKAGTKEVIYFVRDNGVGFNMKYAQKLFGVFQRLHSTEEFEGTGVGLAIVRRIITRHGGRTWAEAELDKGATFYFSIPHN
jgi:PAS domain S-box-containing protein